MRLKRNKLHRIVVFVLLLRSLFLFMRIHAALIVSQMSLREEWEEERVRSSRKRLKDVNF